MTLKELAAAKGYTLRELSLKMGVDGTYGYHLDKKISGTKPYSPKPETIKKLGEILGHNEVASMFKTNENCNKEFTPPPQWLYGETIKNHLTAPIMEITPSSFERLKELQKQKNEAQAGDKPKPILSPENTVILQNLFFDIVDRLKADDDVFALFGRAVYKFMRGKSEEPERGLPVGAEGTE